MMAKRIPATMSLYEAFCARRDELQRLHRAEEERLGLRLSFDRTLASVFCKDKNLKPKHQSRRFEI